MSAAPIDDIPRKSLLINELGPIAAGNAPKKTPNLSATTAHESRNPVMTRRSTAGSAFQSVTFGFGLLLAFATTAAPTSAADWPQFLGPNRNGVSAETGLLEAWPQGGPKEVWRVAGGVGMSGLAIAGPRLCTLVQKDGQQFLIGIDVKTGEQKWQTPLAPEYKNSQGDGPRATPTIHDQTVFAFSGQGVLCAANLSDGNLLWKHNVVTELGGKVADYGMACSPLIAGDLVIVTTGAPQACVIAYRQQSGELAWKAGDDPAGYSSPTLIDVGGKQQIVVFTGASVIGLAPESGKLLWRHPYVTDYDCNTATPISVSGQVLVSSGENHGSVLLKLKPSGDTFDVEEVWSSQGPRSVLRSEWQTPVLLDGKLYGLDNIGSAGPVTNLTCVNAVSGERIWQQPRFGKSNMIAADGKLLFSTMNGEVVAVRATPKGFEEIGRKQVIGPTRQAPALAGGLLYLRDDKEIVGLDIRK
jgi:outer membrane protein assembly factor BamB